MKLPRNEEDFIVIWWAGLAFLVVALFSALFLAAGAVLAANAISSIDCTINPESRRCTLIYERDAKDGW